MSIKRIAICPFCKSEMKKDPEDTIIPMKLRAVSVLISREGNNDIIFDVKDSRHFVLYTCDKCGFVALWRSEL